MPMIKSPWPVLVLAGAALTAPRLGAAAEIVTECPRINDRGSPVVSQALLPDTLTPISAEHRVLTPPFDVTEMDRVYWQPSMAPITDAAFSCTYRDKSKLYVPIVGMLLRCRVWATSSLYFNQWRTWCTSETDPGLLLK